MTPLHRATVLVEHQGGHGTGVIVDSHHVLTAYHVVRQNPIDITFFDGQSRAGRIAWADEERDLALVEVAVPTGHPSVPISCEPPKVGQHLVTIGHPIHSRWVAVGGYLPAGEPIAAKYLSLGFPVGLGASGGPVFDSSGKIVGITLAILAERNSASAGYDEYKDTGIGLMLPASAFCHSLNLS
jgi:S1-C subfamily serine protease